MTAIIAAGCLMRHNRETIYKTIGHGPALPKTCFASVRQEVIKAMGFIRKFNVGRGNCKYLLHWKLTTTRVIQNVKNM